MKTLERAYRRLQISEYTNMIKDTLIPYFDEYDSTYKTVFDSDTVFTIQKHYYKNDFMGWNLYADGILVETFESRRKAKKYLFGIAKTAPS